MKLILVAVFNLFCVLLMGGWLYQKLSPKTAFIKAYEVYDAFDGRKELQRRFDHTMQGEKASLDSMRIEVERVVGSQEGKQEQAQRLWRDYQIRQQNFQAKKEALSAEYNEQVWKQINEYVQAYGKQQGYRYIFGAAGNGSLMYGEQGEDISEAVVVFINQKYQGQ